MTRLKKPEVFESSLPSTSADQGAGIRRFVLAAALYACTIGIGAIALSGIYYTSISAPADKTASVTIPLEESLLRRPKRPELLDPKTLNISLPPAPPVETAAVAEPPAEASQSSQPERRPAPPRGKDEPPPPVSAPRISVAKQELGKPGEAAPPPPPMPKTPAVTPPPEPKAVKEARASPSSGPPKSLGTLGPAKPAAAKPAAAAPTAAAQAWEGLVGGDNVARVRNIMNVARGLGSGQAIAWSNPATGATGFVTLTGWEDQARGCARYRVTRNDTDRVRWESAVVCP